MTAKNILKILCLIAISAFIAGCTSVGDIRTRQPIYNAKSEKNADSIVGCIADKLEAKKMPNVQARPTTNGYTVMRVDQTLYGPDYAFVIDIERAQTTTVVAYSALPFPGGNQMIIESIAGCIK